MIYQSYEELYTKVTGKDCVAYKEFGSYQGDFIIVMADPRRVLGNELIVDVYKGSYGSCTVCDPIQCADLSDSKANDLVGKPMITLDLAYIDHEDLMPLFPANTRLSTVELMHMCKMIIEFAQANKIDVSLPSEED